MAKTIGIILVIASLCGLTWYAVFPLVTEAPDAAQPQAAQNMLATATLEPSQTPTGAPVTPVASPTVNYSATDAQKAVEAAQINLQAAQTQAAGEVQAAAIIATSQYQSDQSALTSIKVQAYAKSTKDAAANEAASIEVERLEAENEAARIKQDEWRVGAIYLTGGGVFLIGLFLMTWLVLSWRARDESEFVSKTKEVTENETHNPPAYLTPATSNRNYPAQTEMDTADLDKVCEFGNRLLYLWDEPISNRNQDIIKPYHLGLLRQILARYGWTKETAEGMLITGEGREELLKIAHLFTDKQPLSPTRNGNAPDRRVLGGTEHDTTQHDTP